MLGTWTRKRCPCLGIANGTGWTNVSTSFRRGVLQVDSDWSFFLNEAATGRLKQN